MAIHGKDLPGREASLWRRRLEQLSHSDGCTLPVSKKGLYKGKHINRLKTSAYHLFRQQFDEREFIIYLGHVNSFEMEAVVEEQYVFTVDRFIIHRDYVGMKRGYKNDIALIRLDREIDFESENTEG